MSFITIDENRFLFDKVKFSDFLYADFCDRKTLYEFMLRIAQLPYVEGKILDYGCGRKPYAALFSTEEYIGIDTENSGHGWDDKTGPDVFFDGETMPFEKDTFDAVISTQVFEHVEDIDCTISEITRVLRRGGTLIVTVPMAEEEHEIPYDFRRYTEIGLKHTLEINGYSIIESGKLNSWKNSMRILKIARLCHDTDKTLISKLHIYIYIFMCNTARMLFGNIVHKNQLFSNKVYCIAQKN